MRTILFAAVAAAALTASVPAHAQFVSEADKAERTEAMARLSFMHGEWSGPATGTNPGGNSYSLTQTERIGPMLGGDILVIEGRGYNDDGSTAFNAFAVISYDPSSDAYEMRSYALGMAGTFPVTLTEDGYVWEIPAGPGGTIRYTSHFSGDTFREVGEYVMTSGQAWPTFEMNLTRRGDTDWPAAGAVQP